MSSFGSKAEALFNQQVAGLIPCHNRLIRDPVTKQVINFECPESLELFHAMADFGVKINDRWLLIEFKCLPLNFLTSPINAAVAESEYSGSKWQKIQKTSWSNSAHKHKIVQDRMMDYNVDYLLVFSHTAKISKQQQNKLDDLKLNWCFQDNLEFFIPDSLPLWSIDK